MIARDNTPIDELQCQVERASLLFALSVPEIEGGHVKWNPGRPCFIRHAVRVFMHDSGAATRRVAEPST